MERLDFDFDLQLCRCAEAKTHEAHKGIFLVFSIAAGSLLFGLSFTGRIKTYTVVYDVSTKLSCHHLEVYYQRCLTTNFLYLLVIGNES